MTNLSGESPISILYPNRTSLKTVSENKTATAFDSPVQKTGNMPAYSKKEVSTSISDNEGEVTDEKNLMASIGETKGGNKMLYLTLTLALLGLSSAGIIYARRNRSEADEYEITEVEE